MSDEIICGTCPKVYRPSQISAYLGEKEAMSLDELRGLPQRSQPEAPRRTWAEKALGQRPTQPKQPAGRLNLESLDRLRAYTFKCPEGHPVDGNSASQFPLAVVGPSGSSKSHVLPALVRELDDLRALRPVGVTMRDSLYADRKLTIDSKKIFRMNQQMGPTPRGALLGPYSYTLELSSDQGHFSSSDYSLLLFDIAGEDLGAVTEIAEKAAYILLCKAILVLIDPAGFLPSQFDQGPASERERLDAGRDVRGDIRVIADTLAAAYEVSSSRELPTSLCFAFAKADAIDWTGGYEWDRQTSAVIEDGAGPGGLTGALRAASDAARIAFEQLGGDLVLDEIEERFDPARIRYAALSATSAMPSRAVERGESEWVDPPEPNGVALSVLQALDLAGLVAGAAPAEA